MILMGCKIRVKPTLGVKQLNRITKAAFSEVAAYWYNHLLQDAFAPGAARRHQHKPRSRKWLEKKAALAKAGVGEDGGTRDIVFMGETRRSVKAYAAIRAFPRRASVKMVGPRHVTMQPTNPNMPNMGAEITHVTESQRRKLMKVFEAAVLKGINTCQDQRTYTVG